MPVYRWGEMLQVLLLLKAVGLILGQWELLVSTLRAMLRG